MVSFNKALGPLISEKFSTLGGGRLTSQDKKGMNICSEKQLGTKESKELEPESIFLDFVNSEPLRMPQV